MKTKLRLILAILLLMGLSACQIANPQSPSSSNSQTSLSDFGSSSSEGQSSSQSEKSSSSSKQDFTGISFNNGEFNYDGQPHSIYVTGAPSFATVTYTNNNKINVGSYTVKATISADGYNTLTKTATLRIIGSEITGISFEDLTVDYDGKAHKIEISGELPTGVAVSYSNNVKTESGTYTATANLSGTGYEPLKLTATLTIVPIPLDNSGYFYNRTYIYDGQNHSVYVDSAPNYVTITYKCLNASGQNTFKNRGCYVVEATIKEDNNHLTKKTALLTIVDTATASVDSSKTPLTIDENLTWDELYSALKNDNFTLKYMTGIYYVDKLDDPRPDDLFSESFKGHSSGHIFATDGKDAFQHSFGMNEDDPTNYYHYYKEVGNDVIHLNFNDEYNLGSTSKFPKAAFSETVAKEASANAFVALNKGKNGEFLPGIDGDDFYNEIGTAFIEDDVFTVLMEHPRDASGGGYKYFYEIYKFYNIGNTTVNVPSSFYPSQDYINNKMGIDTFYLDGVKYNMASFGTAMHMVSYFSAELYVSYLRAIFLEKGTYTVLPQIYDRVVQAIVCTTANHANNGNQSGYNFRLYVDNKGAYQGEYSELGTLERFTINEFLNHNGTVEYYSQWHD